VGIGAGREELGYPPREGTSFVSEMGPIPGGPSPSTVSNSRRLDPLAERSGKFWSVKESTEPQGSDEAASGVERRKPSLSAQEGDGPRGPGLILDEKGRV